MSSPRGHDITTCSKKDGLSKTSPISNSSLYNDSTQSIIHVTHKNNNLNNNNNINNNNNNNFGSHESKSNRHCTRIPISDEYSSLKSSSTMLTSHQHSRSKSTPSNSDFLPADCSSSVSNSCSSSNYYSTLQLKANKMSTNSNCKYKSTSTLPRQMNKNHLKSSKLSTSSPLLPLSAPFEVILKKKDGTLGFTICKKDDGMFYIKSVINEPAINEPAISPGDKILRVNGIDVSSLSHTSAISFLRSLPDIVTLKLEPVIPEDVSLDMEQFNFYSTSRLNKLLDLHEELSNEVKNNNGHKVSSDQGSFYLDKHSNKSNTLDSSQRYPPTLPKDTYSSGNDINSISSNCNNNDNVLDNSPSRTSQPDHLDLSGSSSSLSDIYYTEEDVFTSSKSQKNYSTSSLKKQLRPEALKMISEKGNTDSLSRLRLRKQKSKNRLQGESNSSLPRSSRGGDSINSDKHSSLSGSISNQNDAPIRNKSNYATDSNAGNHKSNVLSPDDVILLLPPEQFSDTHRDSSHVTLYQEVVRPFTQKNISTTSIKLPAGQESNESTHFTDGMQVTDEFTMQLAHATGNHGIPGHPHVTLDNDHRFQSLTSSASNGRGGADVENGKIYNKHKVDKRINSSATSPSAKYSDVSSSSAVKSGESTVTNLVDEERVKFAESTSVTTANASKIKPSPICASKKLPHTTNGASLLSPCSFDLAASTDDANTATSSIDLLLPSALPSNVTQNTEVATSAIETDTKFARSPNSVSVTSAASTSASSSSSSAKYSTALSPLTATAAPTIATAATASSSTSSSTSSSFTGDDAIPSLAKWRGANLVDHLYLAAIRDEQDSGFGDSVTPRHTLDKPLQLSRIINENLPEEESPSSSLAAEQASDDEINHRKEPSSPVDKLKSNQSNSVKPTSVDITAEPSPPRINYLTTTSIPPAVVSKSSDCGSTVTDSPSSSTAKDTCMKSTGTIISCTDAQVSRMPHQPVISSSSPSSAESNNNQMNGLQWSVMKKSADGDDIVIPTITEVTVDVCLVKGWSTRLGIQLEDDTLNRLPRLTIVKSIVPNTIASVDGRIQKGWRLESVNSIPLKEKSVKEVVEFLRKIRGQLNFRFLAPVNNEYQRVG